MDRDKPSRTAYKVAVNIISLGSKPGMEKILPQGIVTATEKILVAAGAASETVVRIARSQWTVAIYEWFDWMMPGQFEAFAHRKAFCERQTLQSIAGGVTQVLVLGAGYDTLGWRLAPEFPGVDFFEIDHPVTADPKAKGIEAMGKRNNLHLLSEDLSLRKLEDVLQADNKWNKTASTVIIAEGLLMYLPPEAVLDLLLQTASLTGPSSRIVFTFIPSGKDGLPYAGRWTVLIRWILRSSGEPWLWSIRPEDLGRFLKETGWDYSPEINGTGKHGIEYFGVAKR